MKKRILAAILSLCIVMIVLPMAVLAAEDNLQPLQGNVVKTLYVGNTELVKECAATDNTVEGITYDADSGTLTLDSAVITKGYTYTGTTTAGIYADGDLNIILNGENIIGSNEYSLSHGINVTGNLTISGSGKITSYGATNGIVASDGSLTIESGTITCYGGKTGLRAEKDLTISGGTVYAEGGLKKEGTFGILANSGLIKITNGNVTAKNTNTTSGYGMKGTTGIVLFGGTIVAEGTTYDIYTQVDKGILIGINAEVNADNNSPEPKLLHGYCGDPTVNDGKNVTWQLTENEDDSDTYTLTISGEGDMIGTMWVDNTDNAPWKDYREKITSLVIDEGITSISASAFRETYITNIELPSTLQHIGNAAFYNIKNEINGDLMIPANVRKIDGWAFAKTSFTGSLNVLPDKVKLEEGVVFYNTNLKGSLNLTKFENLCTQDFEGCGFTGTLILPANIKEIGDREFAKTNFELIVADTSVLILKNQVFADCNSIVAYDLTKVTSLTFNNGNNQFGGTSGSIIYVNDNKIANTVNELGNDGGTTVHYDKGKTSVAVTNGGTFPDDTVFEAGKLTKPIKEGFAFVGWFDNEACEGTAVTAPKAGNTYYAKWADPAEVLAEGTCGATDNEENVKWKLTADGTLTIFGTGAMTDFTGNGLRGWNDYANLITTAVVEEGVTYIGARTFQNLACETIYLPASLEMMDDMAFGSMQELESIVLASGNTHYAVKDGVLFTADMSTLIKYPAKKTNTSYTVPTGVKTLAKHSFSYSGLGGLAQISLPNSLEMIDMYAFAGNAGGESLTIPNSVTQLGAYAFNNNTAIKSLTIGNGLQEIAQAAFYGGVYETITFAEDSHLTGIGKTAFYNCKNLKTISLPATIEKIGSEAFRGCSELVSVADEGVVFTSLKELEVGNNDCKIFYDCQKLASFPLTTSTPLEEIPYAFYNCTSLKSVVIPDATKTIASNAFANCTALEKVQFGKGLETVAMRAFSNCTSLKVIEIDGAIQSIGSYAFTNCPIEKLSISADGNLTIDANAFSTNNPAEDIQTVCVGSKNGTVTFEGGLLKGPNVQAIKFFGNIAFSTSHLFGCDPTNSSNWHTIDMTELTNATTTATNGNLWYFGANESYNNKGIIYVSYDTTKDMLENINLKGSRGVIYAVTVGGTFADDTVFEAGKLANPVKDDFVFVNWYDNAEGNGDPVTEPVSDGIYYAKWDTCPQGDHSGDNLQTNYIAKDSTLTQICADCKKELGTATIEAPTGDLIYDGAEKNATVVKTGSLKNKEIAIAYEKDGATLTGNPKGAGTYTAKITMDGATAETTFVISKATPTVTLTASDTEVRGKKVITLTAKVNGITEGDSYTVTLNGAEGLTVTDMGNGVFEVTIPNKETDYSFTAEVNADGNYEEVTSDAIEVRASYKSGNSGSTTYSISTLSDVENGSVSVSPKNASKNSTVTITVKPDEGYELDKLTVTDKDGNRIKVTGKGNGKYTFTMPACKVEINASFTKIEVPDTNLLFKDVTQTDWYWEAVKYVYEEGMMSGTAADLFSPNLTTTRGMLVTILYRLEDEPAISSVCPFDDIKAGSYYEDAITWAAANNIVAGDGAGKVSPDDAITREQMVAILYRYAQFKGYDTSASADISVFSDAAQISNWALDAIKWACGEELIQGNNAQLMPQGNAIRCQVAAILMRFCELIK